MPFRVYAYDGAGTGAFAEAWRPLRDIQYK
jgi:hypothetical protein